MLCAVCLPAAAQTSGSVSLVSNYLFRGISLSDGNPVAQASVEYDGTQDWYAGLFASPVSIEHDPAHAQAIVYGGYAHPLWGAWSWDAGAGATRFAGDAADNYAEIFAGFSGEHLSGRVSYSPNYYGLDVRTVYTELNANYTLLEPHWRVLAHLGYLHVPPLWYATTASRYDSRVGLAANFGNWDVQLTWVAVERSRATSYYGNDPNPRSGVMSVSYSF
ncbi:MAG: hypothetical protein JO269_11035 [Burkholderiaceae bacterium]|nr:hypothetical protein [Burkholderiaceae bacterium]